MGLCYGMTGMGALLTAYWTAEDYTYGDGTWLIATSLAPGAVLGLLSAALVEMTTLPQLVGAYNGLGGLAATLTGLGLYVAPTSTVWVRDDRIVVAQSDEMLIVQALALWLSIVIGTTTFTGSLVAVAKLHGVLASKPRVLPYRGLANLAMLAIMIVAGALAFGGEQHWNDRGAGLVFILIVTGVAGVYGVCAVLVGGDTRVPLSGVDRPWSTDRNTCRCTHTHTRHE
jgi:NAD(P) transhydrogenase subunit beta